MAEVQEQKVAALEKKVGTGGKSPLFAQLASLYVQQGKAKEALHLCDEGLATFPHYTTGHFIKGKALLALQMNAEAKREFEIVLDFLPANETVAFILSNIHVGDAGALAPPPKPAAVAPPTPAMPPVEEVAEPAATLEVPPAIAEPVVAPPEQPANIFEAVGQTPEVVEDPFGFGGGGGPAAEPPSETTTAEEPANPFEGFPSQPEVESAPATAEPAPANIFDFSTQEMQETPVVPPAQPNEESFEAFAARMRSELGGGENTLSLDDYLGSTPFDQWPTQEEPKSPPTDTIENLAEKLQSAKKITPIINLSTKSTIPASEADTPASTGFVTPTLAEIYAKQGWYDDAIKAYHTLILTKPAEKERFEKRIAELEELKKQQS